VNHCISKSIVALAKDTLSGIALENLTGIRERVTGYRELRASIGKWAFFEIASFIQYKAQVLGVPVYFVDPRNTSQQCSKCGFIDKDNRKTQSEFFCLQCGHKDNADVNAAKNIAQRAVVNQPIALCLEPKGSMRLKCKPTTLVVGS
jgi:IS605 OrfB family transposase